jgi:DNA-binding transcriptional LysR family regulator
MNTEDLNTFLCVAKHQSFSQAALELHLTQPAVSKRVAALEKNFASKLFDRIGRQIHLTEAGLALKSHAERIISELEDSRRSIQNLSGEVSGRLSMATSHHISLHRLPPVLHDYTKRYPEVQLDLSFLDSELACLAVETGELELAVITLPAADNSKLTQINIWTDNLTLAVNADHPLRQEKTISADVLARYPAILPSRGTYTRTLIDETLALHQLEAKLETHYLETIKMLVSVGLGWSLLPDNMLDTTLQAAAGQHIRIKRQLGIVHHPQRTLSNAAKAFIATLST